MAVQPDSEGEELRLRLWRIYGFFLGFFSAFALPVVYTLVMMLLFAVVDWGAFGEMIGPMWMSLLVPGLIEWAWLVPLIVGFGIFRLGRGAALGLAVGGAVLFLLNAACFGVFLVISGGGAVF